MEHAGSLGRVEETIFRKEGGWISRPRTIVTESERTEFGVIAAKAGRWLGCQGTAKDCVETGLRELERYLKTRCRRLPRGYNGLSVASAEFADYLVKLSEQDEGLK